MAVRMPQSAPLSVDDIADPPDDGHRYELIDGCLIVTPSPSFQHQLVSRALHRILDDCAPAGFIALAAPFDWIVSDDTKLQPDLLVFRRADVEPNALRVAPLLAVEIVSPSTRRIDVGTKRLAIAAGGAAHYWIVDPLEPSLVAFDLAGDDFVEVGRAAGDEALTLQTPFAVTIVPSALAA